MSIAKDLADRIGEHAEAAPERNALLRITLSARVTPSDFAVYLANVRHLSLHTVVHLSAAQAVTTARGRPALADHFAHEILEESGHERWADEDREALEARFPVATEPDACASLVRVLDYVARIIQGNPARYLACISFAEYYNLIAAPTWLRALEERCGIPTSMVSEVASECERRAAA